MKKIIRHQGWQGLKFVRPDEQLPAQVPEENSSPETAKLAGCAQKTAGGNV